MAPVKYTSYATSKAGRRRDVAMMAAADRASAAYYARRSGGAMQGVVPAGRAGYSSVARTRGGAVGGEMKYFDSDYSATGITIVTTTWPAGTMADPLTTINLGSAAVANPLCLCVPTVGAALNQRIGRQIHVKKIKIRGTINVPPQSVAATSDTATKIRLMLVQDMQTNSTQMTGAQLIQDATQAATTLCSFQNPNNFGRFRVLKDKVFVIGDMSMTGAAGAIEQSGTKRDFKFTINFKVPVVVHFNATNGGTVADIVDNSFHIVCGTDNTALSPTLAYYARVSYKE